MLFVSVVIPLLPPLGHQRHGPNCNAFQTWRSNSLVYTNISSCFRAGLELYGIDDPDARPTHFRKAASRLIRIHCPNLQEPLGQFMCHDRSTAERHYRHHMSHQYLSRVFTELARCQSHPYENESIIETSNPSKVSQKFIPTINLPIPSKRIITDEINLSDDVTMLDKLINDLIISNSASRTNQVMHELEFPVDSIFLHCA